MAGQRLLCLGYVHVCACTCNFGLNVLAVAGLGTQVPS